MPTIRRMRLHRLDVTERTTWLLVEVETDDGVVGVGECSDATRLDDVPGTTAAAFGVLTEADLGDSCADAGTRLWAWAESASEPGLCFMRGTLVGGIMTALCDAAARRDGVPLWKWLGGEYRQSVPLYANINRSAGRRRPGDFARVAAQAVADGFEAVKLAPFDAAPGTAPSPGEAGVARVRAVRDVVGADVEIYVDAHHRLARGELRDVLPELEDARVGWLEDAADVGTPEELAWLRDHTSIPLAGGERLVDPAAISSALDQRRLSFLLLDPKYVGGPLRLRDLLADVEDVALTFHNPTGPVSTAASAQLATLHPGFAVLEYPYGEDVDRAGLVDPAERVDRGRLALSMDPGIGVRLDHDALPATATTWEWTT